VRSARAGAATGMKAPRSRQSRFVASVTTQGAGTFVAPDDRIAVFDNDGTLCRSSRSSSYSRLIASEPGATAPRMAEQGTVRPFSRRPEDRPQAARRASPNCSQ
jgi:hypothetical protein